jgi:uncharacterized sulfatase
MPITRRAFAGAASAGILVRGAQAPKPNILWITCEDMGPQMGCYGDRYATTPVLDKLAAQSLRYDVAWSNAPVCAPARTAIISGMYPPSTGSEHMRSMTRLPEGMLMYPCYLRQAGYHVTNNNKEDYNLDYTGGSQSAVWHDSSPKAHWRQRGKDQPFFSIFNFTTTHESQIRRRPHTLVHDPAGARVPAYHPDTPEVRRDWAQYYDNITTMDGQAGQVLKELESDGLLNDTIVFFYGDHGPGMPRCKRWPYDSGLRVPLLVHIPEKFQPLAPKEYRAGTATRRMVGFVDLAPTVLSLAGVRPPSHMQGHAFLGAHEAPAQPYLYGFRGRMDERYDCVRSIRDGRFIYIRNYNPHEIYGQHIAYMFEMPTAQVWKRLFDEGKLNGAQARFWKEKEPEELYDLQSDPDEVNNLAGRPEFAAVQRRLHQALNQHTLRIRDVGLLPEDQIHSRAGKDAPYTMGQDAKRYPAERILAAAETASMRRPADVPKLQACLKDADSGVRYWGALGLLMQARKAELAGALNDPAPAVKIVAAEALGRFGDESDLKRAMETLVALAPADKNGAYVSMQALNAVEAIGAKANPWKPQLANIATNDPNAPTRPNDYVHRMLKQLLEQN